MLRSSFRVLRTTRICSRPGHVVRRQQQGIGCGAAVLTQAQRVEYHTTAASCGFLSDDQQVHHNNRLGDVKSHQSIRWLSAGDAAASKDNHEEEESNQDEESNNKNVEDDNYPRFSDLENLHPISKDTLSRAGLETMTEIQYKTWEPVLEGRDVIARARTGTGKTIAFLLPSLERIVSREDDNAATEENRIEVLVISPTRELAQQIGKEAQLLTNGFAYNDEKAVSSATFFGGRPRALDVQAMKTTLPTILTATPGRLLDHLNSTHVNQVPFRDLVKHVKVLVLDEMDSLLDMGFRDAIQDILCYLPQQRQTLLFSATIPPQVREMIDISVAPNRVVVDCIHDADPATHTNENIDQSFVTLPLDNSVWGTVQIILELMKEPHHKLLVFFPTTAQVCFFAKLFNLGLGKPVLEIHSRLPQNRRTQTSDRFRHSQRRRGIVMFTSDVSARGVDYPDVSHVVQVGIPQKRETYIHRLGRTGRAEKHGKGILVLTKPEIIALETDLRGLDITENEQFQQLIDNGDVSPELEEDQMRITSQMRAGELRHLESDAKAVYSGLLGFYFSKLRTLGVRQPQNVVINIMNEFVAQAGLRERPNLPMKLAAQYRLANHPGVNVREEWRAGRNFDVGQGRGRFSQRRFAIPSNNRDGNRGGGNLWGDDDNNKYPRAANRRSRNPFVKR